MLDFTSVLGSCFLWLENYRFCFCLSLRSKKFFSSKSCFFITSKTKPKSQYKHCSYQQKKHQSDFVKHFDNEQILYNFPKESKQSYNIDHHVLQACRDQQTHFCLLNLIITSCPVFHRSKQLNAIGDDCRNDRVSWVR